MLLTQRATGFDGRVSARASNKALIVEDIRESDIELRKHGYECDRITHNELLSSAGTEYTGKLLKGDYSLLWISTPNDWYVRTPTKKANAHWKRIQHWIQKAVVLGMMLILFGPPGFLWKMPNIRETLQESNLTMLRMRLCHFGDKFDNTQTKPSGSYLQLATNIKLSPKKWQCQCQVPIQDHILDWYGRHQTQAEWRKKISWKFTKEVCDTLIGVRGHAPQLVHAIQDDMTPPFPITSDGDLGAAGSRTAVVAARGQTGHPPGEESVPMYERTFVHGQGSRESMIPSTMANHPTITTTLPTESRLRQKQRLQKMKDAGLKPKKRVAITEPGDDDCGDDLRTRP